MGCSCNDNVRRKNNKLSDNKVVGAISEKSKSKYDKSKLLSEQEGIKDCKSLSKQGKIKDNENISLSQIEEIEDDENASSSNQEEIEKNDNISSSEQGEIKKDEKIMLSKNFIIIDNSESSHSKTNKARDSIFGCFSKKLNLLLLLMEIFWKNIVILKLILLNVITFLLPLSH